MTHHNLKCDQHPFALVKAGRKAFELRKNDRNFMRNDTITIHEHDKDRNPTGECITGNITCVVHGYGLEPGWVALGVEWS